jgi:hypothetical protein
VAGSFPTIVLSYFPLPTTWVMLLCSWALFTSGPLEAATCGLKYVKLLFFINLRAIDTCDPENDFADVPQESRTRLERMASEPLKYTCDAIAETASARPKGSTP